MESDISFRFWFSQQYLNLSIFQYLNPIQLLLGGENRYRDWPGAWHLGKKKCLQVLTFYFEVSELLSPQNSFSLLDLEVSFWNDTWYLGELFLFFFFTYKDKTQ